VRRCAYPRSACQPWGRRDPLRRLVLADNEQWPAPLASVASDSRAITALPEGRPPSPRAAPFQPGPAWRPSPSADHAGANQACGQKRSQQGRPTMLSEHGAFPLCEVVLTCYPEKRASTAGVVGLCCPAGIRPTGLRPMLSPTGVCENVRAPIIGSPGSDQSCRRHRHHRRTAAI